MEYHRIYYHKQPQLLGRNVSINNAVESLWCWPMIIDNTITLADNGENSSVPPKISSFSLFDRPLAILASHQTKSDGLHNQHTQHARSPLMCTYKTEPNTENIAQPAQIMQRINVNPSPFKHGCVCGHDFKYRAYDDGVTPTPVMPFIPKTPAIQIKLR